MYDLYYTYRSWKLIVSLGSANILSCGGDLFLLLITRYFPNCVACEFVVSTLRQLVAAEELSVCRRRSKSSSCSNSVDVDYISDQYIYGINCNCCR